MILTSSILRLPSNPFSHVVVQLVVLTSRQHLESRLSIARLIKTQAAHPG